MPDLTPMTREEKFLNGDTDLTPITRREHFYAGTESELPEPDPITREEWFIQKYRGGGGGDITVESLSVTENGTYTAPSGKAYSPVNVNVPLPQNAYLLKSVNTPTPIASFSDGEEMVMPSLKVAIEPQQGGSGDPSPTNIRPISGWDEANVNVSGVNVWDEEWELGLINSNNGSDYPSNNNIRSKYIPIKSGNYYFKTPQNSFIFGYDKNKNYIGRVAGSGAYKNALMTITDTNCAFIRFYVDSSYGTTYNNDISINYPSTDTEYHAYNGHTYTIDLDGTRYGVDLDVINGIGREYKEYPSYNGETLIGPWISDRDAYAEGTTPTIGAQVVDKGDITTFNTIPTAVKSLRGVNNVYANTGDITDAEYFSKEV